MKTPIMTKETIHVDVSEEVMSFSLKVGAVLSALIGIWGLTCLLAGKTFTERDFLSMCRITINQL